MTADRSAPGAVPFVVDQDHPGVSECSWLASPMLASLAPLVLPDVDSAIVVAPHPDDEILGAGGLLQTLAGRGVKIEVCAVTDGEASHAGANEEDLRAIRTAETHEALGRLGLPDTARWRLGVSDGRVAVSEHYVADLLSQHLGPRSLCLAPWPGDRHPDHDACGRAAQAAAERTGGRLLHYLVWAWHWADPMGTDLPWRACRRLDLAPQHLARKRWAISAFSSQIRSSGAGGPPVLPEPVLRHFDRAFEVYLS